MSERLYDIMDWARIEALVYSEEDNPHSFLGAQGKDNGVLIQTFVPSARSIEIEVVGSGKKYEMEREDENGFFAALLPGRKIPEYRYLITNDDGTQQYAGDPYNFEPQIPPEIIERFHAGICYDIYNWLGAHPMTVNGVDGVYFAVWAPSALRVSLVGDFDRWDGRRLPMRRIPESGIFEIFIPGMETGTIYKYEIKARGGLTYLKADPFANAAEFRPNTASIVTDLSSFSWTDEAFLEKRRSWDSHHGPLSIYEVHLGSWKKPDDGREFYNYRELAHMLASYVKEMGYTHLELLPVMEHPLDASWGFQTTGYYAPTSRFGTPEDFMYFMNYMHEQGIGVILDWNPSDFPKDTFGLCGFDGTCLYEHKDPRQGVHPKWGTLLYNYGRPEVRNFLIASALFWNKVFHADGIRVNAVSTILYLDYGKNDGEWIANMYGGNENLDGVEFLKHLSSIFRKESQGALLIAEESASWPKVTGSLEEEGLGFDYKWNEGWLSDFLGYMQLDPICRGYHHGELTLSMIYQYSEEFILALPHSEVTGGKGSMMAKMPGSREKKFANLRAALGFTASHPGKKLLFMGVDIGQFHEWKGEGSIEWNLLEKEEHRKLQTYVRDLLKLYRDEPALYLLDDASEGFEWINNISANENMVVFLRKTEKKEETLLVVCNFSALVYEDHKIGVPFAGKYKEIFNSDSELYAGAGNLNPRVKSSRKDECDGRPDSIRVTVPPLGISIFRCTPVEAPVSGNEKAKAEEAKRAKAGAGRAEKEKTAEKKKTAEKEKTAGKAEKPKTRTPGRTKG